MDMQNNMSWIPFYTSFADKLLNYKNDRNTLLTKLQNVFKTVGMKFPKLEEDDSVIDIDPFTVYGFFNKHLKDANRKAIINALMKEFDVPASVPDDFYGIPVLNNLMAVLFGWDRNDDDIDNLWDLFSTALKLSADYSDMNRKRFIDLYNKVRTQNCIRWNITMALYWIRPYTFINLDSRNRNYMKDKNNISKDIVAEISEMKNVPSGEKYLELCEKCNNLCKSGKYLYNNFPELSYFAWTHSKKISSEEIEEENIDDISSRHYWLYSPGSDASCWNEFYNDGIMGIGWDELDDLRTFNSRNQIKQELQDYYNSEKSFSNDTLATWQFANEIRIGDVVIAKKGKRLIVGCGIVSSDYIFDDSRKSFKHIRKVNWTHNGEWEHPGQAVMKTLTDITSYTDYVEKIKEILGLKDEVAVSKSISSYDKEAFLSDVFITENEYDKLKALVLRKKNVILQGAPGVGKTYSAKCLAYSIIGEINENRICMVQFHQNYSYEDFIIGYRPNDSGGFELRSGIFYNFCERCKENPGEHYFFIIDEINRGNLSKIFGELLMLIETDKRGEKHTINLAYGGRPFYIPENLHIIGMMNTADRSLAMIDYALRRRFSFYTMRPAFENSENNGFDDFIGRIDCPLYHSIIKEIKNLNNVIRNDSALGKGFEIGHSYFSPEDTSVIDDEWVRSTVEYEIIPLIEEYWFDDEEKAAEQKKKLYRALGEEYDGR